MRAMPIRAVSGFSDMRQLKAAWKKNHILYLQESLGLAIFMISACFFSALLFSEQSNWKGLIESDMQRNVIMGVLMGLTALFIFYSPFTARSGSHINPAVTLTFLRLGNMCRYDALFFVFFQITGGTIAVVVMQLLMGEMLTAAPVYSAVTVPGKYGIVTAAVTEFAIAFVTMSMVLFTSHHNKLKKYTRIFAGCLVCTWVIAAGPVSGFGMNPARSLASAIPSNIYTSFWIYLFMPFAGMLLAAELFLLFFKKSINNLSSI
jgi:aquaporin Z